MLYVSSFVAGRFYDHLDNTGKTLGVFSSLDISMVTASFVILTDDGVKLSENIILLCHKGHK